MVNNYSEKIYFALISLIPITIVIGPSISLATIVFIGLLIILNLFFDKNFNILKENTLIILLFFYIYLIFNSFIAIDIKVGALRNFGFIRFILLFLAINYFFYKYKNPENIFLVWTTTIFLIVFDSYIELIFGKNILGNISPYKQRIVSFFIDEPIVGGYLLGFLFLIIGYLLKKIYGKSFVFKSITVLLILISALCILLTGERSNALKCILGFIFFFLINQNIDFKNKIISTFLIFLCFFIVILSSDYLKVRYGKQLFSNFFDKNKRAEFVEGDLYIKLYKSGYAIFKDYPFFGVGNKNYRVVTSKKEYKKDNYFLSTHPHQFYFELLSEHGIIGSLILLSLLFILVFKNLKVIILSRNNIQLGCFVYLLISFLPILPSGSFFGDFNSNLFWLNLSIMYSCNPKTNIFSQQKASVSID